MIEVDVASTNQALPPEPQVVQRKWATSDVTRIEYPSGLCAYRKKFHLVQELGVTEEVVRHRTQREMDLIGRLEHLDLAPELGRLRLIEGDPNAGVLVTEAVAGRPLSEFVLGEFHRDANRGIKALSLAGAWLRQFQSLPITEVDRTFEPQQEAEDLPAYCDTRLCRMRHYGYRWVTDQFRGKVCRTLEQLVQSSPEEDRCLVWAHADYAPNNILWDGERLTPVDFAMSHADYPLTDVTYLIHRLEMLSVYFPWRSWPLETWRRAILEGYGRPDAESSPMYWALMIRHLHCRLTTYVRRRPRCLKERLHNAWTRWRVRERLAAYVQPAPKSNEYFAPNNDTDTDAKG
jgi:tRNA A-37 threonylcarbamoyl transferase component Bud32